MKIDINVSFTAVVPDGTGEEEISRITLDLDPSLVRVDGDEGPLEGARVTGYTTESVEPISPEDDFDEDEQPKGNIQ